MFEYPKLYQKNETEGQAFEQIAFRLQNSVPKNR